MTELYYRLDSTMSTYPGFVTTYYETQQLQGRNQRMQHRKNLHAKHASQNLQSATLDQDLTLKAIETLKASNLPLPVLKHIVELPTKGIEALVLLLNQVQKNISIDWLTAVISSEDPEQSTITVPETSGHHFQRDNGSYWTNSTATTCQVSFADSHHGIQNYNQDTVYSNNHSPFYPAVTLPQNTFADHDFDAHMADASTDMDGFVSVQPSQHTNSSTHGSQSNMVEDGSSFFDDPFAQDFDLAPHLPLAYMDDIQQGSFMTSTESQDALSRPTARETRSSDTVRSNGKPRDKRLCPKSTSINFHIYDGPQDKVEVYHSPCPMCKRVFVSRSEFVAHMDAEHDRMVHYRCSHSGCLFTTYRSTLLIRHHTTKHKNCTDSDTSPPCCTQRRNPRPKRVWGCWLCTWETSESSAWVYHQMQQHRDCTKDDMSYTQLIKSLLSQPKLFEVFRGEISQVQRPGGSQWSPSWSHARSDSTRDELIESLETGFWRGKDFFTDHTARQAVTKSAIDAAKNNKKHTDHAQALIKDERSCNKRPSSPTPTSGLRRLRSFQQQIKSALTHNTLAPAIDTTNVVASGSKDYVNHRHNSLPLRGNSHRVQSMNSNSE